MKVATCKGELGTHRRERKREREREREREDRQTDRQRERERERERHVQLPVLKSLSLSYKNNVGFIKHMHSLYSQLKH